MNKHYFNPKKKRRDPLIENERRRIQNEAVKKSVTRGVHQKPNSKKVRDR